MSATKTLAAFKLLAQQRSSLTKPQAKGDYADQSPVSIALHEVKVEQPSAAPKDDDDDFDCPTCETGAKDMLIEEILSVLLDASPDEVREFLRQQKHG